MDQKCAEQFLKDLESEITKTVGAHFALRNLQSAGPVLENFESTVGRLSVEVSLKSSNETETLTIIANFKKGQ